MTEYTVAVILLNYKNREDTEACIISLLHASHNNMLVVVCDNDSRDGSEEYLRTKFVHAHNVQIIQTGRNGGFAFGNNIGIRYALAFESIKYFWILNNDTEVAAECISRQIAYMQANPGIGLLGVTLVYHSQPDLVQACGGSIMSSWTMISQHIGNGVTLADIPETAVFEKQMSFVSGASMFTSRQFIEDTGLLSEEYFLYYEEADWVARMDRAKYRLGYCRDVVVRHKEGATIGSSTANRRASPFSVFHICRSRLRFARRYYKLAFPIVVLRMMRYALASWLKRDVATYRAIYRAMLGRPSL